MSDDPDPKTPTTPGFGDLESPFLFVPHGAPEPTEWMRKHPGWVKFPATFVPRAPAAVRTIPGTNRPWPLDKRGQPWPRSRFGQPLRPLDEYPPGVRAPGEAYTGPIADPEKGARSYLALMGVLPDPGKPTTGRNPLYQAYLDGKAVADNPAKYAGYLRAEAALVQERPPVQRKAVSAEAEADGVIAPITGEAPQEVNKSGENDGRGVRVVRVAAAGAIAAPAAGGALDGAAAAAAALGRSAATFAGGAAAAGIAALGIVLWPSRTAGPELDETRHPDAGRRGEGHVFHTGNTDDPAQEPPTPGTPAAKPDAAPPAWVPPPGGVVVSDDARRHVLDGEEGGRGGHRYGTGRPGKSEFPPDWSDDKIIEEARSVADDPKSQSRTRVYDRRTEVKGTRDGIDITVVIGADGRSVETAFPTSTPRNPRNK